MTPDLLLYGAAGAAALIAWAVGHYGTSPISALWAKAKSEAAAVEAKAKAAMPNLSQDAANAAVEAINFLTDKSKQQAIIAGAQAEMARMDALLAQIKSKLPQ